MYHLSVDCSEYVKNGHGSAKNHDEDYEDLSKTIERAINHCAMVEDHKKIRESLISKGVFKDRFGRVCKILQKHVVVFHGGVETFVVECMALHTLNVEEVLKKCYARCSNGDKPYKEVVEKLMDNAVKGKKLESWKFVEKFHEIQL